MGLDMYLKGNYYVSKYSDADLFEKLNKLDIPGKPDGAEANEISCEVMYWRKANEIHQWFVDNVQNGVDDCGTYRVRNEDLRKLRDLCNEVLADHTKAKDLLPTQSGFFFGSTDYDEYYFESLKYTSENLTKILDSDMIKEHFWEFSYRSSW